MRNCIILALVAVVWLAVARAETRIEVDENGDEYELKRFYIQGRQLNGDRSQSQCVVTRRKRASRSLASPAMAANSQQLTADELAEVKAQMEHREDAEKVPGQDSKRYVDLSALSGVHLAADVDDDFDEDDDDDDDDDDDEDEPIEAQQLAAVDQAQQQQKQRETGKQQKGNNGYVPAALALPLAPGASTHLPQGLSVLAEPATHANVVTEGGIVVVQSNHPPKVNPDTHALFELKPVNAGWPQEDADDEDDEDEDEDEDEDDYFYYGGNAVYQNADGAYEEEFVSELNPVSTTAIWSTGSDEDDDNAAAKPNKGQRPHRVNRRPNQNMRPNQQQQQKKKKPQQQRPQRPHRPNKKPTPTPVVDVDDSDEMDLVDTVDLSNKQQQKKKKQQQNDSSAVSAASDANKQKPSKKPRPSSSSSVAQKKQKKRRPSSSSSSSSVNKRNKKKTKKTKKQKRRPQNDVSKPNRRRQPSGSRPVGGYKRRLTQQQKRRRQQQRRRRLQQQRRRRNQNRQGYFGDEPIVNCIYINKDPPTTQRPFWNILGRQAGEVDASLAAGAVDPVAAQAVQQAVRRNGDYGPRKRTNLRFVA